MEFEKSFFLAYKVLRGPSSINSEEADKHHITHSQIAGILVVPSINKRRMAGQAFRHEVSLVWKQLSVQVNARTLI